jgi:F-type H+-transporting ATPase subunit b
METTGMGTMFILATEESGFGLNFDILETNLINLAILLGVLFYFGKNIVGNILSTRRNKIEQAIKDAETRQQEAKTALEAQKKSLAEAELKAKSILQEAGTTAEQIKAQILAKGEQDVARIQEMAEQNLNSEQEKAIAQLRQEVTALAMAEVERKLEGMLDDSAQYELIDRSINQLGN